MHFEKSNNTLLSNTTILDGSQINCYLGQAVSSGGLCMLYFHLRKEKNNVKQKPFFFLLLVILMLFMDE